jgi:hypothetical protein
MEFGLFTFNDYWFNGNEGEVAFKNNSGNIELIGTSESHVDFIVNQLENASTEMKKAIIDPKLGVERYMSGMQTLDGDYSSDGRFTEEDFEEKRESLKSKQTLKLSAEEE